MKLKNTKKETSYERDSNGRLILSLEECEKVRAELIEQDKRSAFMGHLYRVYGRNNPDHPLHGHYSGLWQEFKEEAAYIVREQFFDRLEAVRLYEEEQEKKNSNVYTSSHPESDSNAVATGEPATA